MSFSELEKLNRFINSAPDFFRIESIADIKYKDHRFPIFSISVGPENPNLPTFALFGGVHGIEKIGSHIVLNYLKYLAKQLVWDKSLQDLFKISRLVTIPIVNPGGMFLNRRSNPSGVDIMRNSPVKGDGSKWNIVSGHTISPKLPWFKGWPENAMEEETLALVEFVKKQVFSADFSFALDIHSGFGMQDRLWYPYSKTRKPFPLLEKALRTEEVFRDSLPYSRYIIEPQSNSYLINGDVWDYLFDLHFELYQGKKTFIPWCLELGSWTWVKKNPLQGINAKGYFNPILPHRYDRVMRRHRDLIDLFHKITVYHEGIFLK
jgi:hypothetical protein